MNDIESLIKNEQINRRFNQQSVNHEYTEIRDFFFLIPRKLPDMNGNYKWYWLCTQKIECKVTRFFATNSEDHSYWHTITKPIMVRNFI